MTAPLIRLQLTALDCPDPRALALFYAGLLGAEIEEGASDDDWVQLAGEDAGVPTLAFQRAPGHTEPAWPDARESLQAHLDLEVTDLDAGERAVLDAGGRLAGTQPGTTFRVFLDPAGHPFCLVLARSVRAALTTN